MRPLPPLLMAWGLAALLPSACVVVDDVNEATQGPITDEAPRFTASDPSFATSPILSGATCQPMTFTVSVRDSDPTQMLYIHWSFLLQQPQQQPREMRIDGFTGNGQVDRPQRTFTLDPRDTQPLTLVADRYLLRASLQNASLHEYDALTWLLDFTTGNCQ